MNDVMKFGGGTGLVSREALAGALNRAAMTIPTKGGEYQYLKLDKGDGAWVYGQEENEAADDLFAVNPGSFQWGYIAWNDAQVEGEVMVPISRDMPARESLSHVQAENGWQEQRSVNLVGVTGPSTGVQLQYKQGSVGAMKFFKELTDAIYARVAGGEDAIVPIVRLTADDYKHKKYGRIWNPKFEIVEWRTMDDTSAPGTKVETPAAAATAEPAVDDDIEDKALEAEYAAAAAAQTAQPATQVPRRRQRR